jgi:ketosteroid isomerase-like protein
MAEKDNLELVQGIYSAFARGDMKSVLAPFADGLEFQHPMPQSIWPWAGSRSGRQELEEFFAGLSETVEYERLEPRQFITQDDFVAVVLSERTLVRATDVFFEICEVHLFRLDSGDALPSLSRGADQRRGRSQRRLRSSLLFLRRLKTADRESGET